MWENVIKRVYKNNLDDNLASLSINLCGPTIDGNFVDYRSLRKLQDIVAKPIWIDQTTGADFEESKTLELDALQVDIQNKKLAIFDAKYYQINFDGNRVKGNPGVADITKQYLYQLAHSNLADINGFTFTNSFVVPMDDLSEDSGHGVQIDTVQFIMLSALGLQDITVIAHDSATLYKQYMSRF